MHLTIQSQHYNTVRERELYYTLASTNRTRTFQIYIPVSSLLNCNYEHAQPNTVPFIIYFCVISKLVSMYNNQN